MVSMRRWTMGCVLATLVVGCERTNFPKYEWTSTLTAEKTTALFDICNQLPLTPEETERCYRRMHDWLLVLASSD